MLNYVKSLKMIIIYSNSTGNIQLKNTTVLNLMEKLSSRKDVTDGFNKGLI